MNVVIDEFVRSGRVSDRSGASFRPGSAVTVETGLLLYDFVHMHKPARTLEIGMAYAISTLFICQALEDNGAGQHIAIDPNQTSQFKSIGLLNVDRANLAHRLSFIEGPSDAVLPRLCAEDGAVEFAFIDGWHLFDFTLVDFYYIDKMLPVGGHVVFDDLWLPAVRKAVSFVLRNKRYELIQPQSSVPTPAWKRALRITRRFAQDPIGRGVAAKLVQQNVAILRKTSVDSRVWDHYRTF
jgi:predicted O-methyltransferase YrrM